MNPESRQWLEPGDSYQSIENIHHEASPETAADRYMSMANDLYWKSKDLAGAVFLSQAGIQYCLAKAVEMETENPELAIKLRGAAKAVAYNLASFTWPGWAEPGIRITEMELAAGLDAAKLNLRLAVELQRGPQPLSNAYWVLGAHLLAAGLLQKAIQAFELGRLAAIEAENTASVHLMEGYLGLARAAGKQDQAGGEEQLTKALEDLRLLDTDDSRFFIEQLQTARGVFAGS